MKRINLKSCFFRIPSFFYPLSSERHSAHNRHRLGLALSHSRLPFSLHCVGHTPTFLLWRILAIYWTSLRWRVFNYCRVTSPFVFHSRSSVSNPACISIALCLSSVLATHSRYRNKPVQDKKCSDRQPIPVAHLLLRETRHAASDSSNRPQKRWLVCLWQSWRLVSARHTYISMCPDICLWLGATCWKEHGRITSHLFLNEIDCQGWFPFRYCSLSSLEWPQKPVLL